MPTVSFFVAGRPVAKQSFRASSRGGYRDARVTAWQERVAIAAKQAMTGAEPITGPCAVNLVFYMPDRRRVDCDNLSKAVMDACNGIVYKDDAQVWRLDITKVLKDTIYPGVSVRVEWEEGED